MDKNKRVIGRLDNQLKFYTFYYVIATKNVTEYNYKFNIVRDEDALKPYISDCKMQEKIIE